MIAVTEVASAPPALILLPTASVKPLFVLLTCVTGTLILVKLGTVRSSTIFGPFAYPTFPAGSVDSIQILYVELSGRVDIPALEGVGIVVENVVEFTPVVDELHVVAVAISTYRDWTVEDRVSFAVAAALNALVEALLVSLTKPTKLVCAAGPANATVGVGAVVSIVMLLFCKELVPLVGTPELAMAVPVAAVVPVLSLTELGEGNGVALSTFRTTPPGAGVLTAEESPSPATIV